MTTMQIVCSLINFAVLAGGLCFFGGKLLKKMLRTRQGEIEGRLVKAEYAAEAASSCACKMEGDGEESRRRTACAEAEARERKRRVLDQAGSAVREERGRRAARAAEEQAREARAMYSRVGYSSVHALAAKVLEAAGREPFRSACAARTPELAESALRAVKLTRADLLRCRAGGTVEAELASAQPLPPEWTERLRLQLAQSADGAQSIRCSLRVEPALLSGVQIKVGDTLYDMSLSGAVTRLCREAGKAAAGEDVAAALRGYVSGAGIRLEVSQLGRVERVSDGICHIGGLSGAMIGEMLELQDGVTGMVLDLDEERVGCVLLGACEKVHEGDQVRRTGLLMETPVGEAMIGRVVDALGSPIDGLGPIYTEHYRPMESPGPAVIDRQAVTVPLQTGLKAVDALVPIGRGQRELIIGDRQTGKTAIAVDAILNQKETGVICIYVAIGQKESTVASVVERLRSRGAMEYTIVVSAHACEAAPMLYLAPYAGAAMGEYFMYGGQDVLIVYDDLSKQAVAYRELSLLLHRPAGREAFPGDVFYLHSRLLERSARLSEAAGGGSMTALPIIETQAGDISAYIPTNVISITDGQIFLESELFNQGIRPAVNVGLSVSRVGGAAQTGAMKRVAGRLRVELAQYRELSAFAQFGSDLDEATRKVIALGDCQTEALKQPQYAPMPVSRQVLILFAVSEGFADAMPLNEIGAFETGLAEYVENRAPELMAELERGDKLPPEALERLRACIAGYLEGALERGA